MLNNYNEIENNQVKEKIKFGLCANIYEIKIKLFLFWVLQKPPRVLILETSYI